MKTHIYIDTLSAYSTLGACVKSRMSAIVRAQASGCGDNMQLTSFACFCLTSSTQFNSIISTDIMSQCVMQTANAMMPRRAKRTASMVRETPRQVANALQVFNMYCAMSTDLAQCMIVPPYITNSVFISIGMAHADPHYSPATTRHSYPYPAPGFHSQLLRSWPPRQTKGRRHSDSRYDHLIHNPTHGHCGRHSLDTLPPEEALGFGPGSKARQY